VAGLAVIQVTPQVRILVAVEPADIRNCIDGLAREELSSDPFSACVIVFRNRRAISVKIIVFYSCEAPRCVQVLRA
jgi:transposase